MSLGERDGRVIGGQIYTSWDGTQPSKSTRISFSNGVLVLDHQAVAGRLTVGRKLVNHFTTDRSEERLLLHYRNTFRRFFEDETRLCSPEGVARTSRLLLDPISLV